MKNFYSQFSLIFGLLFIVQISFAQNALSSSEYGTQIQNYLNNEKEKLNLSDNDILDLYVANEAFSQATEINHVYVIQRYQGIEIYNAISSVAIREGAVFYYANNFISNINLKANTVSPILNAEQAIINAASHFNLGTVENLELLNSSAKEFEFSNGNISQTTIPVKLMFTETRDGDLRLSWDLSVLTIDGKNWWSVRIDAVSGDVIDTHDWILTCNFGDGHTTHSHDAKTVAAEFSLFKQDNYLMADGSQYNVYELPIESPSHGARTLVSEPASTLASPHGWHDIDDSAGAEYTTTIGNNVMAMEDVNGNGGTGYSPDGGAALSFDFPIDLTMQPGTYQDAAITNLFYMNNMMHDIWYHYGFDESSGNFQENNYRRGAADGAGDSVLAEGQDGSGLNNANFGTPPDGSAPRMQMYLWGGINRLLTINTGPLAGQYVTFTAGFGDPVPNIPITADLVLTVDDNAGNSTDENDACDGITNAADINGKIAVIRRGTCEFGVKMLAAENAGAIAAIVITDDRPAGQMGAGAVGDQVTIPSIMVSAEDGEPIIASLINGDIINATLVDNGAVRLDGDLDNSIVAHEFGHGISNRLTGGRFQAGCLGVPEQMGEGWSDWFALMITMKATDIATDGRGIATYSVGQDTDGRGLRPVPYSTDFGINNFTYEATNDDTDLGGINWNEITHNIGFIWATVLWDMTWAYVEKYGFDPDMYNGTGGNNKAMQIVMDGLKLQPCSPGMVDGRDAILAADMALTGGEDQCMIWEVFAARGLGANAFQGATNNINDQNSDFSLPPDTDPSLANCTSLSVDEFSTGDYRVYPNPANTALFIKTNRSFGEVTITLTDINGRQVLSKEVNLFDTIELDINNLQSGMYILNMKGLNIDSNEKIIKN
jgi:hypothetical protein